MRQKIPTEADYLYTVSSYVFTHGRATKREVRLASQTTCFLCGRFLGTGRIYLEDPDAPGTYCHLSCFHREHFQEDWYQKALQDRENTRP
jgi:hypothetical protein